VQILVRASVTVRFRHGTDGRGCGWRRARVTDSVKGRRAWSSWQWSAIAVSI